MIKDKRQRAAEREKRMQISIRIGEIYDNHCTGCEFNSSGRDNNKYCNTKCNYGKELIQLGDSLGSKNDPREKPSEEEYYALKSEGLSIREVAKKYGWSEHTVKNWIVEWNKNKKKEVVKVVESKEPELIKSAEVDMTKEEFMRLYTEGFKKQEIAKKMDITPVKLSNLVNNKWGLNGWKPDRNRGIVVGYDLRKETSPEVEEVAKAEEDPTRKLHAEIARLKQENEEIMKLRIENKELSDQIDGLKTENEGHEEHLERLIGQMQAKDRSLLELEAKLNHLMRDISNQKPDPIESDYKDLERNYIQVKQALEEMKKSYVYLENQIDAANEEIEQLDTTVFALKDALKLVL